MSRSGRQVRESGGRVSDQTAAKKKEAARGNGIGAVAVAATAAAGALWGGTAYGKGGHIKVESVASGSAKVQINGSNTVITASNRTIINYSRFNIAGNESVQFVQPGRTSTVLNRINSADPSHIDGRLTANGIVYFVNPAGVVFGANAVVERRHALRRRRGHLQQGFPGRQQSLPRRRRRRHRLQRRRHQGEAGLPDRPAGEQHRRDHGRQSRDDGVGQRRSDRRRQRRDLCQCCPA